MRAYYTFIIDCTVHGIEIVQVWTHVEAKMIITSSRLIQLEKHVLPTAEETTFCVEISQILDS